MEAIITVGLGFGDEGKGSIVHHLADDKTLVVRYNGGFQAEHNVYCGGKHHTFSQLGSGSFKGADTYLSENMIINPSAFNMEYSSFEKTSGISPKVYINEDCLVTTKYHEALCRDREKYTFHGSCGVGVGATREMWSKTGDGLFASDLISHSKTKRKLNWIRQWCQDQVPYNEYYSPLEYVDFNEEIFRLNEPDYANIVGRDFRFSNYEKIVFEGSQGMGLDQTYGTIPHTTYSNITPEFAKDICKEFGIDYKILGITRAHQTRHGNGPLQYEIRSNFCDDDNINTESFAGKFRFAHLDLDMLSSYAKMCEVDSLAVNHLDCFKEFTFYGSEGMLIRCRREELIEVITKISPIQIMGYGNENKKSNK